MCSRSFSGIALKREIRRLDWSDSHEDIIEWFGLPDDPEQIVRYEYSPCNGEYDNLTAYRLKVKQDIVPDWWHDRADEIRSEMAGYVERCIVADRRKILGGGPWILVDGAEIECTVNARIIGMYGSASINSMYRSAYVGRMCGSASINIMQEAACVTFMYGSAHIGTMHDSAGVGRNARIGSR